MTKLDTNKRKEILNEFTYDPYFTSFLLLGQFLEQLEELQSSPKEQLDFVHNFARHYVNKIMDLK